MKKQIFLTIENMLDIIQEKTIFVNDGTSEMVSVDYDYEFEPSQKRGKENKINILIDALTHEKFKINGNY